MILILTNQAVFVTLSVVTMPPLAQGIFILTLNHTDVIGDQSHAVTQTAWFRCALCAAISGEISTLIQTGAESWGRLPLPRICCWECRWFIVCFTFFTSFYNTFSGIESPDAPEMVKIVSNMSFVFLRKYYIQLYLILVQRIRVKI